MYILTGRDWDQLFRKVGANYDNVGACPPSFKSSSHRSLKALFVMLE